MTDNSIDLDKLIDSAIGKDRSGIPQLPEQPDASLVSRLQAGNNSPNSGLPKAALKIARAGILRQTPFRFLLGLFSIAAIGTVSYFLFFSSTAEITPLRNSGSAVTPIDSLIKRKNDTIAIKVNNQKMKGAESPVPAEKASSDSVSSKSTTKPFHPNDLLPASTKEVRKDGIAVPIEENH